MVGLIDDFGVLTPPQKLLGQTMAALVLVKSGTYIKLTYLPVWVAIPLSVLWILAVTNALNIIDILDGLASGVAAIAALSIAVANFNAGRGSVAFLCIVLCGSLLGFLRHNFYPATIYLGDAGSLFIGFMLAALSMNAGYTRETGYVMRVSNEKSDQKGAKSEGGSRLVRFSCWCPKVMASNRTVA